MTLYSYVAINERGHKVKGTMDASNPTDLEERLRSIKLDLLSQKEARTGRGFLASKVTNRDMVMLCIHLEQLERAGVPLLESLADLRDSSDSEAVKNMMSEIYESVKGGEMLSEAMSHHKEAFNDIFVNLVAAGEKTGKMAVIFGHLSEHLKWVSEIQRKVKKATYYPAFLMVIMFVVVSVMMTFVVPKLSDFLTQQNFDLPGYTVALIATSHIFENYWYMILIVPVGTVIGIRILYRMSEGFAYQLDNLLLHLPVFGTTIRKIEFARFCHFFSVTFQSGIGILECLDIGHSVVNNRILKETILDVRKSVSEGTSLTKSLVNTNQFPSLVIRMFKVGEDTGALEDALHNVNFFYDREVNDAVNNMVGIVQPALTIILGGIMLWVSVAIFGPLYNSFSKMSF